LIIVSLLIEFPDVRTVAEDDDAGNDEVREELLVFLHVTFPTWTAIAALLVVAAADIILPPAAMGGDAS
jgi:hypothetical protein